VRRAGAGIAVLLLLSLAGGLLSSADAAPKKSKKKTAAAKTKAAPANFDAKLPILGTKLAQLPAGPGKESADAACITCHSADLIAQQRLTEKQWAAEITKMTGWGADVPPDKRDELVAYLVKNFGPDAKFEPVVSRPVGR
jgi:cytochrome c5